jgi:hypothetical protein
MKLYLLAGGLLLTAASVYGITDYVKTKNQKEFTDLYKEHPQEKKANVTLADIQEEDYSRGKLETAPPAPIETKKAVAKKPVKTKPTKTRKTKTVSYASVGTTAEIQPTAVEVKENVTPQPEVTIATAPKEKKTVRKKVNMKMFSRAAPARINQEVIKEEKKQ